MDAPIDSDQTEANTNREDGNIAELATKSPDQLADLEFATLWQVFDLLDPVRIDDVLRAVDNEKQDNGRTVSLILRGYKDSEKRSEVAIKRFGHKLAGDLGFRSTQGHPTMYYGEPSFVGSFDLADN